MPQNRAIANKPKLIHWKKAGRGNPYNVKPHPAMLKDSGYKRLRHIWLTGKKRGLEKELVAIHYDTDYVIQKIVVEILEPLRITEPSQLEKILILAWNEYKAKSLE